MELGRLVQAAYCIAYGVLQSQMSPRVTCSNYVTEGASTTLTVRNMSQPMRSAADLLPRILPVGKADSAMWSLSHMVIFQLSAALFG